ncbi:hypothetical protein DMB38_10465 [Streptomyces sp. WAC 06738]|uniref:TolB family protein n=1 Tax=Streptomyces sp. WAC 06738 TaxID=2203210 RepID=UPI000F6CB91A|nr:PD40 domain-containing protein [Streptomyces sp. WAC 06738]AZM46186.1 hypothetical protein DMB38_10465 [Streptomyces sp. WAC 06738]
MAWAPDGERILFHTMRSDQTQRLEWIATDGTGREVLNTTGGHDAAFSPDGESLAFLTTTCWDTGEDNNCGRDLHVLHLASGKVSTLTTDHRGGEWTRPDWSADGRHIVYSTGYGLRSVDVSDGTFLDVRIPVYAWTPVFSPDGDRIAFTGQDDASTRKVYVVDATPGASATVLSDRQLDLRDWLAQ